MVQTPPEYFYVTTQGKTLWDTKIQYEYTFYEGFYMFGVYLTKVQFILVVAGISLLGLVVCCCLCVMLKKKTKLLDSTVNKAQEVLIKRMQGQQQPKMGRGTLALFGFKDEADFHDRQAVYEAENPAAVITPKPASNGGKTAPEVDMRCNIEGAFGVYFTSGLA